MASENGETFIKNLAYFVRTHEKALANALQLRRQSSKPVPALHNGPKSPTLGSFPGSLSAPSASSALAAAFSLGSLSFSTHSIKPAKLTLTPHHLFYLLSRFDELGIEVGAMNVRLENIHAETAPGNYVSFLSQSKTVGGRSADRDTVHSPSGVRGAISSMSSYWSGSGKDASAARVERAQALLQAETKYLYSAFTKIPCLKLSPDRKARLISGYEEFPFDTAVPLLAFKNVSALEVTDLDFRQFFGWDKLAEQLRSLTVRRAHLDDPVDLLVGIVLDDMDKRRRRSSKPHGSPITPAMPTSPSFRNVEMARNMSASDWQLSKSLSPRGKSYMTSELDPPGARGIPAHRREKSTSPNRPSGPQQASSYKHVRRGSEMKRSGSGSSTSSAHSGRMPSRSKSSSSIYALGILPASKWRFLRHLSLADNGLTALTASSLAPLANTLHSLDLSSNLFTGIPDSLAILTALRALNLSNCMIGSLHSLARSPLPAISALNLRSNRLTSLAGVERLFSLERLDLRDNRLVDPSELARLTGIPDMREVWVQNNPFVRSHLDYRITVFNLFRSTPGHREDVLIDSSGPGYNERRSLRERIAEPASVPVMIRQPHVEFDNPHAGKHYDSASGAYGYSIEDPRPPLTTTQSETAVGSNRRRKAGRRRIVDLSIGDTGTGVESPPLTPLPAMEAMTTASDSPVKKSTMPRQGPCTTASDDPPITGNDPFTDRTEPLIQSPESSNYKGVPADTSLQLRQSAALPDMSPASQMRYVNLNGEAYRRKAEALKDEFGSGWLRILSEDGWNGHASATIDFAHPAAMRPSLTDVRTQSQGIVSGNRTLG